LKPAFRIAVIAFALIACARIHAQAKPTATEATSLSVFAGATGLYTGLSSGRNISFTAGIDYRILTIYGLEPSIEVRGTYPIDDGSVDAQQNFLAGIRISKPYRRFHPYGDVLYGRGEINYEGRGYITPDNRYIFQQSFSNVLAGGGGIDIDLAPSFALKADAQLWHQNVPVTASGTLNSTAITLGVVYHFDFNHHPREK
jgi:hypothetical protein